MTRHRHSSLSLGALAITAGLVLAVISPASARIIEQGPIDDEFSGTDDNFCDAGLVVDYAGTATGRFRVNERKPGDDIAYYMENVRVVQTFTDRASGLWVTDVAPNTLDKDLSIVDNEDGTATITALLTGGGRLYGHEGRLIAKGSGQVRFEIVYDYVNDVELSDELVFGSTGTNDDYCAAILEDWGY